MGTGDRCQPECSLNDFDIMNMNRVFLQSATHVAKGYNELCISFSDPEKRFGLGCSYSQQALISPFLLDYLNWGYL